MQTDKDKKHATHSVACAECDLILDLPLNVAQNQEINCSRCHHKIISGTSHGREHVFAITVTAIIAFLLSISFNFLSIKAQGQVTSISLISVSSALFNNQYYLLAFLVIGFVALFPLLYLTFILLSFIPARWLAVIVPPALLGRAIVSFLPWVMTEVFLIGVLVALIKVISLADIVFGFSFWAYTVFTVLFIYISTVANIHRLWQWIEA